MDLRTSINSTSSVSSKHRLSTDFNGLQVCSRCIYDENIGGITFDDQGVCNYCHQVDSMGDLYGTGTDKGLKKLEQLIAQIKSSWN